MNSVKTLAVALSGTLMASALAASASPAAAASETTVTGRDGVIWEGCPDHKYDYAFDASDYPGWDADVTFRGPSGRVVGRDYLYKGTDASSGVGTFAFCYGDPEGRYTIDLVVTFYDEEGDETGSTSDRDAFRLRKPRTRTSFTVSDMTPRYHQILTFRILSKIEQPRKFRPNDYEDVVLEARRPGGWERIPGSKDFTNGRGVVRLKARWERRKPLAIRAVTLSTQVFNGSESKARELG